MDDMKKLFDVFKLILDTHIKCKTTEPLYHEKTAPVYELMFDLYHELGEKLMDTEEGNAEEPDFQEVYDAVEEVKGMVEDMIKEKPSVGTDNLLRSFADKLEFQCGNMRAFIKEEQEID